MSGFDSKRAHFSPSPGTPGEGGGEGSFSNIEDRTPSPQNPHPNPLPEYRARGALVGMARVNAALGVWTILVLIFLYLPILLLIVYSFNAARWSSAWEGFTVHWYLDIADNRPLLASLVTSLIVAGLTTVISTILGTLGAWVGYRYGTRFQKLLDATFLLPVVMPEILMGVSLLIFFALIRLQLGYATLVIAHTTFCFPFVLLAVRARLAGMDPSLEEAAMDLGATPRTAFFRVILPYLRPAVISGALMSFTLSIDELIISFFLAGPSAQTLPMKIFGMARTGQTATLNAVSTLLIIATCIFVALITYMNRRSNDGQVSARVAI